MVIFTKPSGYPHSLFLPFFVILGSWRNTVINHKSLETKLIQQQNLYIRMLEEQLAVCEKKNKAQELLIEQLNQILDLFAGDPSNMKAQKEKMQKET